MSKKSRQEYTPSLPPIPPRRRSYKGHRDEIYPTIILPFTRYPKDGNDKTSQCLWYVPRIDDYPLACRIGSEYAAHFAQFLKDNPEEAAENYLGHIASEIDFEDASDARGYWIGFFTELGRYIRAGVKNIDVYEDLDRHNAEMAALLGDDEESDEEP